MNFFLSLLVSIYIFQTSAWDAEEFLKSLQQYEIVYPKVLVRSKRSISENNENYNVNVLIKNWTLVTETNPHLTISPDFRIQFINSDSEIEMDNENFQLPTCEILRGHVAGFKDSKATLTICDDHFYGMINIMGTMYVYQSLADGRHVLYEESEDKQFKFFADKENFDDIYPRNKSKPEVFKKHEKLNETICYVTEINKFGKKTKIAKPELCLSNLVHDTLKERKFHHNAGKKWRYGNLYTKEGNTKNLKRNKRAHTWLDLSNDEVLDPEGLPEFFALREKLTRTLCTDNEYIRSTLQNEQIRQKCAGQFNNFVHLFTCFLSY